LLGLPSSGAPSTRNPHDWRFEKVGSLLWLLTKFAESAAFPYAVTPVLCFQQARRTDHVSQIITAGLTIAE
jgi:hypothetical protein